MTPNGDPGIPSLSRSDADRITISFHSVEAILTTGLSIVASSSLSGF